MKKILFVILSLMMAAPAFAEEFQEIEIKKDSAKIAAKAAKKAEKDSIKIAGAHRYRTTIKLDGVKLDQPQLQLLLSDIEGTNQVESWEKYVRRHNWGKGLTIAGSSVVGAGGVVFVFGMAYILVGVIVIALTAGLGDSDEILKPGATMLSVGAIGMLAGGAIDAVGIPLLVSANHKMRDICDGYNTATQKVDKQLILGGTGNGVGLAFRF